MTAKCKKEWENFSELKRKKEIQYSQGVKQKAKCDQYKHGHISKGQITLGLEAYSKVFAAAAIKSLYLCPTLCDRMDNSPPGSSVHRILQERIREWDAISFSIVKYLSVFEICCKVTGDF